LWAPDYAYPHAFRLGKLRLAGPFYLNDGINRKYDRINDMAKNRVTTHLACETCKERNYSQIVSKKRSAGSLKLNKFCSRCRKHVMHKETK
jgi:large subunit ribosomal protein L33